MSKIRKSRTKILIVSICVLLIFIIFGAWFWGGKSHLSIFFSLPQKTVASDDFSLTIDRIDVHVPIIEGVDPTNEIEYDQKLSNGVAHMIGSAVPGVGGNIFIYGHSSADLPSPYAKIFANIDQLMPGDKIVVRYLNKDYNYLVTGQKVINSDDFSVLANAGHETLTLMTCWPVGTSDKRLVVFADRK